MKRYNFTITELLTVIAIIAILAGIAIPAINSARRRARTTTCINNQGQTMKMLINVMNDNRNKLYSGRNFSSSISNDATTRENVTWTQYLADKRYIKSMEALRCPDIHNYTTTEKELTIASIQEAYGLVSTENDKGPFDFRGSKLFMYGGRTGTQIAPSALIIGGCAIITKNNEKVASVTANFSPESNTITGVGRPAKLHHNKTVNLFSFDGHAETADAESYAHNRYYPDQDGSSGPQALDVKADSLFEAN